MKIGRYKIKFCSCIKNKDKSRTLNRLLKKVDVDSAIKYKKIDYYIEQGKYLGSWIDEESDELVASYDTPTVIFYSLK